MKEARAVAENEKTENKNVNDPSKFDWITPRFACTLPTVFKELHTQIEQDVKTRNSLRPNLASYEFSISDQNNAFQVFLKSTDPQKEFQTGVMFTLTDHAIRIRDAKGVDIFEVKLTFTDQGQCQLQVNGEDREYWQIRRQALEDLMFHSN